MKEHEQSLFINNTEARNKYKRIKLKLKLKTAMKPRKTLVHVLVRDRKKEALQMTKNCRTKRTNNPYIENNIGANKQLFKKLGISTTENT